MSKTKKLLDRLHQLRLFIGGLEHYPGARQDASDIAQRIDDMQARFTNSYDTISASDIQQYRHLRDWARTVDGVYRRGKDPYAGQRTIDETNE